MDQAVSFDFFVSMVCKYWRSIVVWTLIGVLVSAGITFFVITPQYKASVQILVSRHNENAATQYTNQQADVQMITTYKELITNQVVLTPASKALKKQYDYKYSLGRLKNEVAVSSTQNSQVFSIDVTDANSVRGAQVANQIAKSFKTEVKKIIKVNNVTIVSPASPAMTPTSPKKMLNLFIGLFTGLLLGIAYASIRIVTDRRVHDVDFLTIELGLNGLGQVNHQHLHKHVKHQVEQLQNKQIHRESVSVQKRV